MIVCFLHVLSYLDKAWNELKAIAQVIRKVYLYNIVYHMELIYVS